MRPGILILALAVAIPWANPADARTEKAPPPSIGVVPFVNEPGDPMAVQVVQSEVVAHLTKLGFVVEGNGRIDAYLRKNRVRARNAMPRDMAKELAEMLGVRYLLFGTVTHWEQNRGPQVGITARIVEPERGLTLWAHAVSLDAPEAPGVNCKTWYQQVPELFEMTTVVEGGAPKEVASMIPGVLERIKVTPELAARVARVAANCDSEIIK